MAMKGLVAFRLQLALPCLAKLMPCHFASSQDEEGKKKMGTDLIIIVRDIGKAGLEVLWIYRSVAWSYLLPRASRGSAGGTTRLFSSFAGM